MKTNKLVIAIDFDGTCVKNNFPDIGESIGAEEVLRELVDAGHKLILYTMRSDKKEVQSDNADIHAVPGNYLTQAVAWFTKNNIQLYSTQINPKQQSWTSSNKCYADLYIDDAALGIPLVYPENEKPHVNWQLTRGLLIEKGVLV